MQSNELYLVSAKIFESELMRMSKELVWKDEFIARTYEDPEEYTNVDLYLAAVRRLLSRHPVSYLIGILNDNIETIQPIMSRMATVDKEEELYRKALQTFKNYKEKNAYYNMLQGIPASESEFVYITDDPSIPDDIPVHKLPSQYIGRLESTGKFAEILAANPKKEYLHHLSEKRIFPFVARTASRFELLYVPDTEPKILSIDFGINYDICREYITKIFYNEVKEIHNDQYNGFIAMSILFMTIQKMHAKYLEADITRDFYDVDSLKMIYESYSVPFYPDIPIKYHEKIVKDINRLISYKGGNKVIFDLFQIFDYGNLTVYQYYLLKERKFIQESETKRSLVPIDEYYEGGDQNEYTFSFVKVDIEKDPYLQILDPNNKLDYGLITQSDPSWIEDRDLQTKMYHSVYNYLETKYIGVQFMFDLTDLLYESSYFFKMLLDNKDSTKTIYVFHDRLGIPIPLFDMVMYVFALICKKKGYAGNIPYDVEQVARVYGFNFKDTLNVIINDIRSNSLIDNRIAIMLSNMNINDLNSVHTVFSNIKDIREFIEIQMIKTTDRATFVAYRDLYKTLLTTEQLPEVYQSINGQAETFKDVLKISEYDNENILYNKVNELEESDLAAELDYCLIALKNLSSSLKYLEYVDSLDAEIIGEYLYKMLRYFISLKTELADFDVIYLINSRTDNLLKLMMDLKDLYIENEWPNERMTDFFDNIEAIFSTDSFTDSSMLSYTMEFFNEIKEIYLKGSYDFESRIKAIEVELIDYKLTSSFFIRENQLQHNEIIKKNNLNFFDRLIKDPNNIL